MRMVRTQIIAVILLLNIVFPKQLLAFSGPPLTYLGIEQGLSNNTVNCIYQDHKGFMWFGTIDGLNRYDGYGFKIFRNNLKVPGSLGSNWINCMEEDSNRDLWIGTRQGVSIYNNFSGKFTALYYTSANNRVRQKVLHANAIRADNRGNMLIVTTETGLLVCTRGADTAIQVPLMHAGRQDWKYHVKAIDIDATNRVWLFVQNYGLCLYDVTAQKIKLVNETIQDARCLETDGEYCWISTPEGLHRYNILTNSYEKVYNERQGTLLSNIITDLWMDKKNKDLWIAGDGVNIFQTTTERIEDLFPGNRSLSSRAARVIYEDREGRKWIGTLRGGINVLDPLKSQFQAVVHDPSHANSLINDFVLSFLEIPGDQLWIGTDGGGLSVWDRKTNRFANYKHDRRNPSSLSNNFVTSIKKDYLNNIWLSTYGGGINRYQSATNSFKQYACKSDDGREFRNVWLLYEDSNKDLWACTFGGGFIFRYNRTKDRFEVFDRQFTDVVAIAEDKTGALWAGNATHLINLDRKNGRHTAFYIGKPIRAIYEDKAGNCWLGTDGGGLILFDRQQHKIAARYTTEDGLCNNAVLNILEDRQGNLWMSTYNGLSKFDVASKTFKSYYKGDGLQSNQFNYNAALALSSGELAFGSIKGLNVFYPGNIVSVRHVPPLWLTEIKVNNVSLDQDNSYATRKDGSNIDALKVPYDKAVLSFDFTALEYSSPEKVTYAYFLEGWDRGWNYTGNMRTATYTHLKEGAYTFRVKSTNAEGTWNPGEIALTIIVLPPWYRSWWAYLLYAAGAIGVAYLYLKHRARQARLRYEINLEKIKVRSEKAEREKREAELAREKAEHEAQVAELARERAQRALEQSEHAAEKAMAEKEREESERRMSFFTNISHEFRTPLTLIINPVKDMLEKQSHTPEDSGELAIIYRNARRMLSLTNQLLLLRKEESGLDRVCPVQLDLVALCYDVYLCFAQQAKAREITYHFESSTSFMELYADRDKLEIILYNLLSNAMKYTPAGGDIRFTISDDEGKVKVLVADSGPGIAPEAAGRIFEKFYQAKGAGKAVKAGFGIGLYLARQFTGAHHGDIGFTERPGGGTVFNVTLLKGCTHFSEEELAGHTDAGTDNGLLQELAGQEEPESVRTAALADMAGDTGELVASEKQTVLVIDDDASIRQYLAMIFKDTYQVYEAANGEAGIAMARKILPDIIISDIMMEKVSGIELCKAIKEHPSLGHIPVILLTGSSNEELRLQGVKGGADDYITKPFNKELLLARVSNLLKNRNNLQRYFYNEITLTNQDAKIPEQYRRFLEKCIQVVEEHLDDDNFNIKVLATIMGMSYSAATKKIKAISGQSLNGFVRFVRLRKAARLFIDTNYNVNEVATMVGIFDARYFREQFLKLFGMKPSEYIKKYRQPFANKFSVNRDALKGDAPEGEA